MQCSEAINILKKEFPKMRILFGIRHLALFGSVARNEATSKSDIDLLVEFENKATYDNFMELKFYLEDLLNTPVDLVTRDALKPRLRSHIEKDLLYVA